MKVSQETEIARNSPPSGEGQGDRTMKSHAAVLAVMCVFVSSFVFADDASNSPNDVFITLTRTDRSQNDLPTNTQVTTAQDFSNWSPQTAGEASERMTSVQILSYGGLGAQQTAQIRGATANQTQIQIDGRPVGGIAFSGSQDMTEIPVEDIDHIEVVRGGVSALYGPNAMGGVLNVITQRGTDQPTGSMGYDMGSYGRNIFRANYGGKNGPLDYFVYGDTQHEDGFRQNGDGTTLNAGGNFGFALPVGKVTVDGSDYQGQIGVPGSNFTPVNQFNNDIERTASSPTAIQNVETKVLHTAYSVPLPSESLLTVKAWESERHVEYQDPFNNTDRLETSKGTELQADLPMGFVVGGDFIHDREDTTDNITASNSFIRWEENYAFFAQDTMKWKSITLIPSGRFDHNDEFGDTSNPRVQLLADATPWLRFSGSSGRSFRAPTIDDLYYPFTDFGSFPDPSSGRYIDDTYQGNPNLRPETAWTYDAGFELHNDAASFKATYFRSNDTNLIQTIDVYTANSGTLADPDVFAAQTINVGKARRQGLEIEIEHRLNQYFKDNWNYTYLDNVGIPVGYTTEVPLAYSPRHTANWIATFSPLPVLDLSSTLHYEDSRFDGNDDTGMKLGSMVLWDLRIAYRWKQLESFFQVNDVTDRRYEEQAGYPLPGRTFIGGVTLHFFGDSK
jgi:outer membrane cobalamin receptor